MLRRALHLSASATAANTKKTVKMHQGKALKHVVKALEEFAPLSLAEKWDNVGLLIKPYRQRVIRKIILTNDLSERVMQEAVDKNTDLIISYHPPIFAPLKRIAQDNWKERIVSRCLAESIALYSPHTAWDAVPNGINDWLASAFPCENIKPIQPNPNAPEGTGAGRVFTTSITLADAIKAMQQHIGLDVHVAIGTEQTLDTIIKTVAVCAGSGGSLLKDVTADLYVTGEMSHHDVLDAQHLNTSIILCNHSNSERGFLKEFKKKLNGWFGDECEVIISTQDEDPLKTFVKNF